MQLHRIAIVVAIGFVGAAALGFKADFLPTLPDSVVAPIQSMTESVKTSATGTASDKEQTSTVYKWVDAKGEIHYSNAPPKKGEKVIEMKISSQQNVVGSNTAEPTAAATVEKDTGLSRLLESYHKPVEKAVEARDKMEQHNREIENINR